MGETWTLQVTVTSTDTEDRVFGFAGAGGFHELTVPAGASGQTMYLTDTIGQVDSRFEYRGSGTCGPVSFTDVCLFQGSVAPTPAPTPDACWRPGDSQALRCSSSPEVIFRP